MENGAGNQSLMSRMCDQTSGSLSVSSQCFELTFSLSCPEMFRKFPFLYNLLWVLLAQGQIQLVQPNFRSPGVTGRPLVLNIVFRIEDMEIKNVKGPFQCKGIPIMKMRQSDLLTHWGRDKMATIFQATFSNAFAWIKIYDLRLRFHWSLFSRVQLTIF